MASNENPNTLKFYTREVKTLQQLSKERSRKLWIRGIIAIALFIAAVVINILDERKIVDETTTYRIFFVACVFGFTITGTCWWMLWEKRKEEKL